MATVVNVYFARRWRYKMGEHTPGPWKLQECYDGKYEMTHPGETLEETRLIGVIAPACNIKNDAPLIEAAPDLLDVAEYSLKIVENLPCECDSYNGFTCKKHEWERKLRKAINKAKGGDE